MRPTAIERARHLWRCFESRQFWLDIEAEGITQAEAYAGIDLANADREREFLDARVLGSPEYGSRPQADVRPAPARPVERASKAPKIVAA